MDIVSETTIKESCAWVLDSDRGAAPVPSQFPRRLHTEIPWLSWIRNIKHESEMGGQCRKECWAPMDLVWRVRCFPLFRTAMPSETVRKKTWESDPFTPLQSKEESDQFTPLHREMPGTRCLARKCVDSKSS